MILKRLLNTGAINVPWPVCDSDGRVYDSRLGVHVYCETKCMNKECMTASPGMIGGVCDIGLAFYKGTVGGLSVTVYGVVDDDSRRMIKNKEVKKQSKGRYVTRKMFSSWISNIQDLLSLVEKERENAVSDAVHSFHDTLKWAQQIHIIAEKSISGSCGDSDSFAECFEKCTNDQKSMYKAAQSLVDTFDTAEIYINPNNAKAGKKRVVTLYKMIDRIQSVIYYAEASSRNKRFKIIGNSYNKVELYESFKLIPMALLQNAVKYSSGNVIEIHIEDVVGGVSVSVCSDGPHIPIDETRKIFEKEYRGGCASKLHHDGVGMGLYIARIVAHAHDTDIYVRSEPYDYDKDGIPQARNTFSITVT